MSDLKPISDVVACVVDRGTFFPVAERLARDCAQVYYHKPNGEDFETFAKSGMGDGFPKVELLQDFWPVKNEIDLFVFPDCSDAGLQVELTSQGFAVWGSRYSDAYEKMRGKWVQACQVMGLPMPTTHRIKGVTNLDIFLREHEGETFFVKISKLRGDMETWKASERHANSNKLDLLRMKFGPMSDEVLFCVQEPVETKIEAGADTYSVNGQWPGKIILGYEKKGAAYFATWKERSDMPKEVWGPMESVTEILRSEGYANMVSSEVRVTEDGKSYWLDPCFRFPSPAGEEQLELYGNFSEILWKGGNGILQEPEMTAKLCGECVIRYRGDEDGWKSVVVPDEVKRWVKFYACVHYDGAYHFPPDQDVEAIGCVVGLGDTPSEVLDHLKEVQEALKDAPVDLNISELSDLFEEIDVAAEQGIHFSDKPLPEPAEAITSA